MKVKDTINKVKDREANNVKDPIADAMAF